MFFLVPPLQYAFSESFSSFPTARTHAVSIGLTSEHRGVSEHVVGAM